VWATTVGAVAGPNLGPVSARITAGVDVGGVAVPPLASPFAVSVVMFGLGALLLTLLLRPDPLLLARRIAGTLADGKTAGGGMRAAWGEVLAQPSARLGVGAMAVGHLVMVAVMAMTPVHILGAGHGPDHTLRIVGIVLSLHIAGMFAFAPVTGWLTDRYGRRRVILGGITLLLAACAIAGTAGHHSVQLSVGLFLLGLGWSGTMVAGSTLLSESVPEPVRPSAQGLSDLVMGLAGAAGGAASGLVVALAGYPTLTLLAAVSALPLLALALRPVREKLYV
jgi:MFS family permease